MPNMVTAFKHSLLSFYADLKNKTQKKPNFIKALQKKAVWKKPPVSATEPSAENSSLAWLKSQNKILYLHVW